MPDDISISATLREDVQRKLENIGDSANNTSADLAALSATATALEGTLMDQPDPYDDMSDSIGEARDELVDMHKPAQDVNRTIRDIEDVDFSKARGAFDAMSDDMREFKRQDFGEEVFGRIDPEKMRLIEPDRFDEEVFDQIDPEKMRLIEPDTRDRMRRMDDTFDMDGMDQVIRDMDEMDDRADSLITSNRHLGNVAESTARNIEREADEFAEAADDALSLAEMKEFTKDNNQALARAAGITQDEIQDEAESMILARQTSQELADSLRGLNNETKENIIAMGGSSAAVKTYEQSLRGLEDQIEETGDEADNTGRKFNELGIDALRASINIGPLNFALRNMATQIPVLLTLLGGMTASLAGVASAAVAAGSAFAGVFGAGLLQMGQRVAEQNEDVEDSMEGVQQVMENFRSEIAQGLTPLMNEQSINMLNRFVDGLQMFIGMMSRGAAQIQPFLSQLQANMGDAFFGNLNEVINALQQNIMRLGPFITDFIDWFMRGLPEALRFFNKEGERILPTIAEFGTQMLRTTKAFADFGITLFKAVLPVINIFLRIITDIIQVVNSIPDGFLVSALGVVAFVELLRRTFKIATQVKEVIKSVALSIASLGEEYQDLADNIDDARNSQESFTDALKEFNKEANRDISGEEDDPGGVLGDIVKAGVILSNISETITIVRVALAKIGQILSGVGISIGTGLFGISASTIAAIAAGIGIVAVTISKLTTAISIGIDRFSEILNLGQGFGDMMGGISAIAGGVMSILSGVWDILSAIGQTFINIQSILIIRFFEVLAGVLDFILNDIGPLNEIVALIGEGFKIAASEANDFEDALRGVGETADRVLSLIATSFERAINTAIDQINRIIRGYNRLLQIPGFRTAVSKSTGIPAQSLDRVSPLEDVDFRSRDFGQEDNRQTGRPSPEVNYTVEEGDKNVEVDARPEDDQRIKQTVKDALEEANTFRRRKNGFSG